MNLVKICLILPVLLLSNIVFASEQISTQAIKKVIDLYYSGQSHVSLVDVKICGGIHKKGNKKNECTKELKSVKKDQVSYFWTMFFVPYNTKANVMVQFSHNGITRKIKNIQVAGSLRYRTHIPLKFKQAGNWNVKIMHDMGSDVKDIGSYKIVVQ
ncbi:MAG: hypothetical protein HON94_11775 [Methylococcales bacterium]|nr:hypothetical protein [Methylococcales bacterium]